MKRVLVTGSSRGIGLAIAKKFVREGYEVIVHCSKDPARAEGIRAGIGAAMAVTADLSSLSETRELYEKTGNVDILILNASVQYKAKWEDITDEAFAEQVNVNLRSTLKLIQLYYPHMKEQGYGRILTIGSTNQHRQHPELPMYAATKCAVYSLVKNIAKFAAPYGVTVNNLAPGAIATPRNAEIYNDPDARRKVEETIPAGRFGSAEECADAAFFLCSEEAAYITGADIVEDGGLSL